MRPISLWKGLLAVFLIALFAVGAIAQTGTSSVKGTVVDQTGGVIPNAKVTLTNIETKQARTQNTSATGAFSFDFIAPGDYTVDVEAPQFKKLSITVHALIARPAEVVARLEVGGTSQVVTVTAENTNVAVNTADSALGNNFVFEQITQLPMEARNVVSLLSLQPGVTSAPDNEGYVAGARSDQSNITLDGVNINNAETNSVRGPVLRLNSEAIEEFRVSTTTANANAGRSSGAQIELVTKGGTNQLRGSVFEYHRERFFNSNEWFNNHATPQVLRPQMIRNTFGATVGGPIKKDKVFFFYSYEGRRDAKQTAQSANYVPLPGLGQGLIKFHNTSGGITTLTPDDLQAIYPDTGGENPAAVAALAAAAAKYPANDFSVGDSTQNDQLNIAGFRFNAATPVKLNSHVAKFDFNLTNSQTMFLRFNDMHDHTTSASYFPDTKQPQEWNHPIGVAAAHTWTIHNTLVNNFRYGLTRQAYSNTGDLEGNDIWFRFVFYPVAGSRTTSRITPVQNFVDDVSWIKGNHTFQFGGFITTVNNQRISYSTSWDNGNTNPTGYIPGILSPVVDQYVFQQYGTHIASKDLTTVDNTVAALIGRLAQYTANVNYTVDGKLMQSGMPTTRKFATTGYEGYAQDTWKLRRNLTLTAGLRYSLWKPVWEKQGYEVQPTIPLGVYWDRRVAAMLTGTSYTDLIVINKSGPVNGGAPMYNWDKKVFLPRASLAWSPGADTGLLKRLFGGPGKSVLRGGFAITNDYFGQAIATFFDARNTLGFNSATAVPVNTFNLGCGPYMKESNGTVMSFCDPNNVSDYTGPILGPLFTAYGMDIRSLPKIPPVGDLTFPAAKPAAVQPQAIESSIDSNLKTPREYVWSVTFERQLPHGSMFQASYIGRMGRDLLAQRDIATPADLVDPASGMDWYTAATILEKFRQKGTPVANIATIPYFENLFVLPTTTKTSWCNPVPVANCSNTQAIYNRAATRWRNDWTDLQLDIDRRNTIGSPVDGTYHAFFQPQYGALDVWSTVAFSNYHALAMSFRQRLRDLTVDVNYTYSHSLDNASGLQANGSWSSSALIMNPLRPRDNYASSNFDMRHMINVNSVWQLPIGRGRALLGDAHGVLEAIFGGWQISNIFRWNTGTPFGAPYDDSRWATNFQVQSNTTPLVPLPTSGCVDKFRYSNPKFFGCGDLTSFYQSFRNAYPGEGGPRNIYRMPAYVNLDSGLGKTWKMPYREGHEMQFRWEVFNVTNTQQFNSVSGGKTVWGLTYDPALRNVEAPTTWSNFVSVQGRNGEPFRVMQFGLRYSF